MQNAATDDATDTPTRRCRGCKVRIPGNPIGRAPACPKCRAAEIEKRNFIRRERSKHERDSAINAAHAAVDKAIRQGDIPPASEVPCEDAASLPKCGGRHAWHHDDYSRPLDVRCLCAVHHSWWHSRHKAVRGDLVKCAANGCRAETDEYAGGWLCPDHTPKKSPPQWTGHWLSGRYGSAVIARCRVGFNVTAYVHKDGKHSNSVVRVHEPEEMRAEMRRVYTLVTGLEVA